MVQTHRPLLHPPAISLAALSLACAPGVAGYSAYQLLSPSACLSLLLTTDAPAPEASSPEATPAYKAYLASGPRNIATFWALQGADGQGPTHWADCAWRPQEIACTVIGNAPVPSFKGPLGQSSEWVRTCLTPQAGQGGPLRIYSVDTSEYEEGGKPVVNRYLKADKARLGAPCKPTLQPRQPVRP